MDARAGLCPAPWRAWAGGYRRATRDRAGHHGSVSAPRDDAGLTEIRGKWLLPVGNGKVTQIRVDYAFTLVLEAWISIRIETSFSYGPAGGARQFEPSDAAGLAPLLGLHQATVTSAEIRKDGRLTHGLRRWRRACRAAGRAL
jgi:Family of unknown function (DUF6188)